ALQDINRRVPQDVSVIGFDNIKAAAFTMPRLTTINQPLEEIGRIATQTLLNQIHNTMPPQDEITVEPQLIIRDSTGPVPQTPWKMS
ncbi:MAG: substrate-binding domain-containing protein, partial [Terracidiphilus sp.]